MAVIPESGTFLFALASLPGVGANGRSEASESVPDGVGLALGAPELKTEGAALACAREHRAMMPHNEDDQNDSRRTPEILRSTRAR